MINHDPVAFKLWRKAQARREQPLDARATTSRAGEAFSWRGKGHTGNGISGGGGAGGGTSVEAGRAPSGKQKLGVMDRLGLVSDHTVAGGGRRRERDAIVGCFYFMFFGGQPRGKHTTMVRRLLAAAHSLDRRW